MENMRTIKEWLGEETTSFTILEALVKAAILDPVEDVRKTAIDSLGEMLSEKVKLNKGFVGDGQIMVELQQEDYREVLYVCDVPKQYITGHEVKSIPFVIEQ